LRETHSSNTCSGSEDSPHDKHMKIVVATDHAGFLMIRQIQIQPERGLTFAAGIKSVLRQDPDIVLIGEIRDNETAEHAVRASLTGRIVFSTLHSGTSTGTIARLIDTGVERSLIAFAVSGAISSRLVKRPAQDARCRTGAEGGGSVGGRG
jgi:type IV pilus assembly protein PilB